MPELVPHREVAGTEGAENRICLRARIMRLT
jgi:hypothetical protein